MRFSTVQYRVLGSVLVTGGLALAYGCVSSSDNNNNANAGGSGNTAGTGNLTGGGNSITGQSGNATACATPTKALITDWTPPEGGVGDGGLTFGDFTTTLSGGTFIYPTPAITSDETGGNWHIFGTVGDYTGMGLYFNNCYLVDAHAYRGISFTISGTINSPTPGSLTMGVSIAATTIAYSWFVANDAGSTAKPSFGTCVPKSNNQYDGTCGDPKYTFTIPSNPTVTVLWTQFAGGTNNGGTTSIPVDPATITGIYWAFPWTGSGQTPYTVDITIDDLSFVE